MATDHRLLADVTELLHEALASHNPRFMPGAKLSGEPCAWKRYTAGGVAGDSLHAGISQIASTIADKLEACRTPVEELVLCPIPVTLNGGGCAVGVDFYIKRTPPRVCAAL